MDRIESKVLNFINDSIGLKRGSTVLVGVSGGPDSVALFRIMYNLKSALGIDLHVVHVEHGIRGEDSMRDAEFTANLVEEFHVPYSVVHVDVPAFSKEMGMSEEEAARVLRYRAFREEKAKLATCDREVFIAVAHHKEDSVETLLLQLVRGSGLKGITGLKAVRDDVIRPLLPLAKEELLEYLKRIGQDYCVDKTNFDDDISRNRIRHDVLPVLKEINLKAMDHILHSGQIVLEAEEYISKQAICWLENNESEEGVDTKAFSELESVLKKQVVLEYLRKTETHAKDISAKQIEAVVSLMGGPNGKSVDLSGGLVARKQNDRLKVLQSGTEAERSELFDVEIPELSDGETKTIDVAEYRVEMEVFSDWKNREKPEMPYTKWFDYDKIKSNLHLRNRAEGDFVTIDKEGHTQKLRRFFINEKVPQDERDESLLLARDSEVIWIVGRRVGAGFEVTDNTKRTIEIIVRRERNE